MKNHIKYLALLLICVMTAACGGQDVQLALERAEKALQDGNLEQAASYCRSLTDDHSLQLTPMQMCRLALVCSKLYMATEDDSYAATAATLIEKAEAADADAVREYYDNLPVEDQASLQPIKELSSIVKSQTSYSIDCDDEADDGEPESTSAYATE